MGTVTYGFDVFNRLREVAKGATVVEHAYDALHRRVVTSRANVTGEPALTTYTYDDISVIEERDGTGSLTRRFVLGETNDTYIRVDNLWYDNPGTYYYQEDGNGNVVAMTDTQGAIVERYTYDAYGMPVFRAPGGSLKMTGRSEYGNPYLFTGRRYERGGENLYYYRSRDFSPARGRFLQRDMIGEWADGLSLGNAFCYTGNNPWSWRDYMGLEGRRGGSLVVHARAGTMSNPNPLAPVRDTGHVNITITDHDRNRSVTVGFSPDGWDDKVPAGASVAGKAGKEDPANSYGDGKGNSSRAIPLSPADMDRLREMWKQVRKRPSVWNLYRNNCAHWVRSTLLRVDYFRERPSGRLQSGAWLPLSWYNWNRTGAGSRLGSVAEANYGTRWNGGE